jgi:hypothetical protein
MVVAVPSVRLPPVLLLPNMESEVPPVAMVAAELLAVDEVAEDVPMLLESEGLRRGPVLLVLLLRPEDEAGESVVELEDINYRRREREKERERRLERWSCRCSRVLVCVCVLFVFEFCCVSGLSIVSLGKQKRAKSENVSLWAWCQEEQERES